MTPEQAEALLSNVDELGFIDPTNAELLLGAIGAMGAVQKRAAISKLTQTRISAGGTNLSSRDEAMLRLGALPADIRKGLADKRLQLVDTVFYVVKTPGAATTQKMLTNADTKSVGISNIANGKLDKDQHMLLTHIRLTSGAALAGAAAAAFGTAELGILNGQVEFKCGSKYILPNEIGNHIFNTTGLTMVTPGTYRLNNPKWLEPQQQMEFNLAFSQALAANTHVRLELIGTSVAPY